MRGRGLAAPIVEFGRKGNHALHRPNADASKILPDEINRKRGLLFDMVGLFCSIKKLRRQTAESNRSLTSWTLRAR